MFTQIIGTCKGFQNEQVNKHRVHPFLWKSIGVGGPFSKAVIFIPISSDFYFAKLAFCFTINYWEVLIHTLLLWYSSSCIANSSKTKQEVPTLLINILFEVWPSLYYYRLGSQVYKERFFPKITKMYSRIYGLLWELLNNWLGLGRIPTIQSGSTSAPPTSSDSWFHRETEPLLWQIQSLCTSLRRPRTEE